MTSCTGNLPQIHMLVEEELEPGSAERLNEHINACVRCSEQFDEFKRLKHLFEESLSAKLAYQDSTLTIMHRISGIEPRKHGKPINVFFKRVLVGAAASVALIILSAYLFVHFYFQKTFSCELNKMAVRCSGNIQMAKQGTDWQTLRVGDPLEKGTRIRTAAEAESFLSFDGIRLFTEGETQIQVTDLRAFSLEKGNVFVASVKKRLPLTVKLGEATISANGGVFQIGRSNEANHVGVASETVNLTLPDGTTHTLVANQTATFGEKEASFRLAQVEVSNPFTRLKVSVIDRIKQRFAEVISKYHPDYQLTRRSGKTSAKSDIPDMWSRPEDMLQFALYIPSVSSNYVRAVARELGDYYDSLFVPSNRTIAIGRVKEISPGRFKKITHPAWSHDGSMIAYAENTLDSWRTVVKVARLDDPAHPWVISQEYETVLPMTPLAWAPDNRHVLFMVTDNLELLGNRWTWREHKIKIAPIDPAEGPLRDFESPFPDIHLPLPLPVGQTIWPQILKLPWGDAMLCGNWGNLGYIPIEENGQAVAGAPGVFLTDFNPYELYVVGGIWSSSGSKIMFMAAEKLKVNPVNVYILYDVEDILDGFAPPPNSLDDPRIKRVAPSKNPQFLGGFSFDESLVFFQEDVNNEWRAEYSNVFFFSDFDFFLANALPGEPGMETQIHLPGNQVFLTPSPEGNRIANCTYDGIKCDLKIVSFEIEADIDADLGGVLIDNSGTNLIVPPGVLEENLKIKISTPFTLEEEAEVYTTEKRFFAMRLIDAQGLEKPKFIEPMILTIRYTDDEVAGLNEGMLEVYYYDERDPDHPIWVSLGGTVDPVHNEITVEIRHFSKFCIGGKPHEAILR